LQPFKKGLHPKISFLWGKFSFWGEALFLFKKEKGLFLSKI